MFFAITPEPFVVAEMTRHLGEVYGVEVIGWTNKLADRRPPLSRWAPST